MSAASELVVLVDDHGGVIGSASKASVHTRDTPLHLAFSCYVVDDEGRVLVTRRALTKRAWPGVWTNAFCGHPAPGEANESAVVRRAHDELGAAVSDIRVVLPDFRYRATDASGIVENEICPVYLARIDGAPQPAPDEVAETAWTTWDDLARATTSAPYAFSPWLVGQLPGVLAALGKDGAR